MLPNKFPQAAFSSLPFAGASRTGHRSTKSNKKRASKKKAQRDCFSQSSVETKWNSFETQSEVARENLHVRIQGSIEVEVAKVSR